jgi:IS5 family transposase
MQRTFSELEYAGKKKRTRRDRFLGEIEAVTPWKALVEVLEPYYPKSGGRGRPPVGLERMLRMYVAQQCFGLADEAMEDAIYDSQAICQFVGIDLGRESAPDATTLLNFRHLLEQHALTQAIFEAINAHLAQKGLLMKQGTIVDATIIAAPSLTKNEKGERDPEMHQTKKGNQWYFGMKAHIGVDSDTGMVHSLVGTAANVADVTQAHQLLHGEETDVFADAGYRGVEQREALADCAAAWHVAMGPAAIKALPDTAEGREQKWIEQMKAGLRALVEHPFHVVKNRFGLRKLRYRGLAKNTAHLFTLFGLANLVIARKRLLIVSSRIALCG